MKFARLFLVMVLLAAMALPVTAAQQKTKLPQGAYIKSAKISLLGVPPRFEEAKRFLDSVLFYYGPAPEAYFLRGNIFAEYATRETDPGNKIELYSTMTANYDSMYAACKNNDLKSNLKNDCNKFSRLIDSIRVFYWGDNYNNGVKSLERIDNELIPKVKETTDTTEILSTVQELQSAIDSAKISFAIATVVDPGRFRAFEGLGLVFDRMKDFDSSIYYFEKASRLVPDSGRLVQNIAYCYIQQEDWSNAVTYFKKYLKYDPNNSGIFFNIAISYNNLRESDSAYAYDLKAIAADSTLASAFVDIGQYFLLRSQQFNDSVKTSKQANKNAESDNFQKIRDAQLDSSAHYFSQAGKLEPENAPVLEQYGVVLTVLGRTVEAKEVFKKLTELESFRKEHWINLGYAYIQEQKFEEAIVPFEKALEIDPGDTKVMEVLKDLYANNGNPEKAKEIEAKMNELNKM
jgi:tetratricopeptide (TPR) repeat protein